MATNRGSKSGGIALPARFGAQATPSGLSDALLWRCGCISTSVHEVMTCCVRSVQALVVRTTRRGLTGLARETDETAYAESTFIDWSTSNLEELQARMAISEACGAKSALTLGSTLVFGTCPVVVDELIADLGLSRIYRPLSAGVRGGNEPLPQQGFRGAGVTRLKSRLLFEP